MKNSTKSIKVTKAQTFITRLIGWMGKKIEFNEILILSSCRRIHTFGMREPIDVVFLDSRDEIVYLVENMEKSKISPFVSRARTVMEMKGGMIAKLGIRVGDRIMIDVPEPESADDNPYLNNRMIPKK